MHKGFLPAGAHERSNRTGGSWLVGWLAWQRRNTTGAGSRAVAPPLPFALCRCQTKTLPAASWRRPFPVSFLSLRSKLRSPARVRLPRPEHPANGAPVVALVGVAQVARVGGEPRQVRHRLREHQRSRGR